MTQKKINSSFQESRRIAEINHKNNHLLRHLMDINSGKRTCVPDQQASRTKHSELDKLSAQNFLQLQRLKASKIDAENRRLMGRILKSSSTLNLTEIKQSYQKVKQFKRLH